MSVVRFDGVAVEDIRIGAGVAIEMDTRTGRMTVRAANGLPVDAGKGEWRGECRPDPRFDTSVRRWNAAPRWLAWSTENATMHDRRMYCLRCEDLGLCQHRVNTVGMLAPGWSLTMLGTGLVAIFMTLANRMVAEKHVSLWGDGNLAATVCVVFALLVLGAMVVFLGAVARFLRARGDSTILTCVACNGTDLVPEQSTRYRREMKQRQGASKVA